MEGQIAHWERSDMLDQNEVKRLLDILADSDPVKPFGWFRWVHDRYATGLLKGGTHYMDALLSQGWGTLCKEPDCLLQPDCRQLWVEVLKRHAWTVGRLGLVNQAVPFWKMVSRQVRGSFMAGYSDSEYGIRDIEAIRLRIPEAEFTAEAFCQLACNLTHCQRPDILELLFTEDTDWLSPIERMPSADPLSIHFDRILSRLSQRPIDVVLEAALFWQSLDAISIAVSHGADLNLPVWSLQRLSNACHCPLSYAIAAGYRDSAELLLKLGASVEGSEFAGRNAPFFRALLQNWFDLADRLLEQGLRFEFTPPVVENVVLQGAKPYSSLNFLCTTTELEWVSKSFCGLIPFVPVDHKQIYYDADAKGGAFHTLLGCMVTNLEMIKKCESLGLDTSLSIEEFCIAVQQHAIPSLEYLLEKNGAEIKDRVMSLIRQHKPDFGEKQQAYDSPRIPENAFPE